jgi:hypothetical protein
MGLFDFMVFEYLLERFELWFEDSLGLRRVRLEIEYLKDLGHLTEKGPERIEPRAHRRERDDVVVEVGHIPRMYIMERQDGNGAMTYSTIKSPFRLCPRKAFSKISAVKTKGGGAHLPSIS